LDTNNEILLCATLYRRLLCYSLYLCYSPSSHYLSSPDFLFISCYHGGTWIWDKM